MDLLGANKIRVYWKLISGKKTIFGIILHILWLIISIIVKSIDFDTAISGHKIISIITGVGVGHKVVKYIKKRHG